MIKVYNSIEFKCQNQECKIGLHFKNTKNFDKNAIQSNKVYCIECETLNKKKSIFNKCAGWEDYIFNISIFFPFKLRFEEGIR